MRKNHCLKTETEYFKDVVNRSLTDKEKIDYEIEQKANKKDEELVNWLKAIYLVIAIGIVSIIILKSCTG